MKCDKLKPLVFSLADLAYVDEVSVTKNFQNPHDHAVYKATEVDEAITELKEAIRIKDELLIENGKQIGELKAKLHDAEMRADLAEAAATERKIDYDNLKKDLAYHARKVYFKTHRQTLRALWLARAERAKCKIEWFRLWNTQISTMNPEDGARQEYDRWLKVEQLCKEKAEEYK